ncbi:HD domain-containing protein [Streptomyces sp. NPDC051976]|uniref:HD domain-containing protein n=1 Tax=Streptomyces sp. NPDC051976 TaxID=3154947 RepID=UPI00342CA07E
MGAVEDARIGGIDLSVHAEFDRQSRDVYPLLFRLLDGAAIAEVLWDESLAAPQREVIAVGLGVSAEEARSLTAFLAGLRELGKLVPAFQQRERVAWARVSHALAADTGRIPEDAIGAVASGRMSMHVALGLLEEAGFAGGGNDAPAVRAAQVVGGMIGRFQQVDVAGAASPRRVAATAGGPAWRDLRSRYVRLVRYLTGASRVPKEFSVPAAVLVCGVGMLAGRLAGQRRAWTEGAHMPAFGAGGHFARARARARDLVAEAELERIELDPVEFATAHGHPAPNELQASLMSALPDLAAEHGAGIVVVADATGSGKSITGLDASRIFSQECGTAGAAWFMPTTATADSAWEMLVRYVQAHEPGRAPVTLVHSHSYLNAAYTDARLAAPPAPPRPHSGPTAPAGGGAAAQAPAGTPEGGVERGHAAAAASVPDGFLRGHDAALLAQFTAATIDQAQMAVLPVNSNALRLLALSGRTVIIDEAHAMEPYSQLQLLRLLNWLGALRTPVVLLSATLPSTTARKMVHAYLAGAGVPPEHLAARSGQLTPGYPGWVFADAATGRAHCMPGAARERHAAARRRRLRITRVPVEHRPLGETGRTIEAGERLAAVSAALGPVMDGGGCAAVACQSVADAQDTYRYLRSLWPGDPQEVILLHARIPAFVRETLTAHLRDVLGPSGRRPSRLVVVTTSLLDTSLDIDFDLMVADLATIARLLQLAGRLGRFAYLWQQAGRRPPWWSSGHIPQLTVLDPCGRTGATAIPPGWGTIEPAALLHATAGILARSGGDQVLTVPDDVQDLVEQVHGSNSPFDQATTALQRLLDGHLDRITAQEHTSAIHLVPPAVHVSSLADLHRQHLTPAQAATRLGTLPRRLLPCYRSPSGRLTLDRAGTVPLPDQRYLTTGQIRDILSHAVPVPAAWVARPGPPHRTPDSWSEHPLLADLVPLPAPAEVADHSEQFGIHRLRMDDDLGLVHHRTP